MAENLGKFIAEMVGSFRREEIEMLEIKSVSCLLNSVPFVH